MCTPDQIALLGKYGISPNNPGLIERERLPTEPVAPPSTPTPPPAPVEPDQRERDFDWVARQTAPPPAPRMTFQAAAPPTAQSLSEERVDKAAPQSLGGIAARFSVPTGKQGYSKSLRPEAGRLVR